MERDGPVFRVVGHEHGGFIGYRDLGGIEGSELDGLIARQVRVFTERREPFEWKLHGHDRPPDLPQRLTAAGFVPEPTETVVVARVADIDTRALPPNGVVLREVRERHDLDRIATMEEAIWRDGRGWQAESLEAEIAADRDAISIVVAEANGSVVCAGWVRFERGTEFATLWGGATLPKWRGCGIYRAVVSLRADLAGLRGFRYLQVDASDDSRPILERLGFVPLTTTTPFIWTPSDPDA